MGNKKNIIIALIVGIMIGTTLSVSASSLIQAYHNDTIKISLDGEVQEFRDETTNEIEYPITYNDRTYLPLRSLATLLGFEVDYDESTKTAIIKTFNDNKEVEEVVDKDTNKGKNEEESEKKTNEQESEEVVSSENVKVEEIDKSEIEITIPKVPAELTPIKPILPGDRPPDVEIPPQPKPKLEVM